MTEAQHKTVAKAGWKPALCLLVIAPVAGELITSSAPPFVFFIPWVFTLFSLLYGCGAILVREFSIRWQTGWAGVLLMGASYGILEEALGAKSFFDPQWRALGLLGVHGRWLGVNWVWTLGLTLFHSVFCIGLSILTASLPFPAARNQRWLGNKSLAVVGLLYSLVLILFFQKGNENQYRVSDFYYGISIAFAASFVAAAWLAPRSESTTKESSSVPYTFFGWLGFGSVLSFVLILYAVPSTGVSPWLTGALLTGLGLAMFFFLSRWSRSGSLALSSRQEVALVCGAIGAWAIQGPFQEWNPARKDSAAGMSMVGIGCLIFMFWLWRRVRRTNTTELKGESYAS